jgi:hypothetical protein
MVEESVQHRRSTPPTVSLPENIDYERLEHIMEGLVRKLMPPAGDIHSAPSGVKEMIGVPRPLRNSLRSQTAQLAHIAATAQLAHIAATAQLAQTSTTTVRQFSQHSEISTVQRPLSGIKPDPSGVQRLSGIRQVWQSEEKEQLIRSNPSFTSETCNTSKTF